MVRSLEEYRRKRDPSRTPEPFGGDRGSRAGNLFVVQQHRARSLHWDLRLEIDGTLVSWAIPKGPSSDPGEKRLAVQTEDHPLEYGDFEGVIPAGSYGAGAMILWDRGAWATSDGQSPAAALASGKLDLTLHGHKLRGRWALVRLKKSESGRDWLFFKKADTFASNEDILERLPASVVSGLTVDQRFDPSARVEALRSRAEATGAVRHRLSRADLVPMLARTADAAFSDRHWLFELKYDGFRALLGRDHDGTVRLQSRRGRDLRQTFPEIALVGRHLPARSFAIDGEIIAVEDSGAGSFGLLQQRVSGASRVAVVMYAFDLLHLEGYDLRPLPLIERKTLLRDLLPPCGSVRYADHVVGDGEALLAAAKERHLEGIVAKRADSPYRSGQRSGDWLKIKLPRTSALAIVGWQPGKSGRRIGSLLLAWLIGAELRYAGSVGSGIGAEIEANLAERLAAARVGRPHFEWGEIDPPASASFVEPELVASVRYAEITANGALRQPVFLGLDDTKSWRDCTAPPELAGSGEDEVAATVRAQPRSAWSPSNLDKVFWPAEGYTKGDLLRYYEKAWPFLSVYLKDRPLVLTRYPDGIEGKSFFQKNAPDFLPDWIATALVDDTELFLCNDLDSLLYIINLGCIPLHIWSARRQSIERPDWLVLDLDPKQAPFGDVVTVARHLHAVLADLGLRHYVKTSGQAGLHVMLPLANVLTHEQAKMLGEVLARVAAAERPDIATVARPLGDRGGKVYIDYLQNGRGKTIAAPFCVRPQPGAPVSTPLRWTQVTARLDPSRFTITTALSTIGRRGDPLSSILDDPVDAGQLFDTVVRLQSRLGGAGE